MATVVGVRFHEQGRIHLLDPGKLRLTVGDRVLVEVDREVRLATVALEPRDRPTTHCRMPLPHVLRVATDEDEQQAAAMAKRREKALRICRQKIRQYKLKMRLVDAVCSLNGKRITFHFSAENRVDFRKLVKDLAAVFHTRIQMEQIGVRDEAGRLGGCGPCGRPLCCTSFLPQFYPVNIKMAKEQWLSLNPAKISGLCGRLLCCLRYEYDTYRNLNARMPKPGSRVEVHGTTGKVLDINPLSGRVTVELSTGTRETFPVEEIHFEVPATRTKARAKPTSGATTGKPQPAPPQKGRATVPEPSFEGKRKRRRKKKSRGGAGPTTEPSPPLQDQATPAAAVATESPDTQSPSTKGRPGSSSRGRRSRSRKRSRTAARAAADTGKGGKAATRPSQPPSE